MKRTILVLAFALSCVSAYGEKRVDMTTDLQDTAPKFMLKDGNFMLQCGNFVLKDAKMLIKCGILGHKLPIFDKKDDRIQRYQMEYGLNSMISDKNKTLITLLLK